MEKAKRTSRIPDDAFWLTVPRASARTGISQNNIKKYIKADMIRWCQPNVRVLVFVDDLKNIDLTKLPKLRKN